MAVLIGSAAAAAPGDPESFASKGVKLDRFKGVFPPHIKCVAILTPASVPNESKMRLGIQMLERAGLKVKVMPHTFDKVSKGRKKLPASGRIADFKAAWNDPEVDMIIPTRGGAVLRIFRRKSIGTNLKNAKSSLWDTAISPV
ncbi:MAG: LD-carboxypeptidase [Lentisphaeria bacterium]|nr:LD-carboxypeptidase [Lentisphaeria bacterium]